MKKFLLNIIPIILMVAGCINSAKPAENLIENSTANSDLIKLNQALSEAANIIDERIPEGSKIAPLNFNSPHDKFSDYILEELTANLVDSRKLTVVDRREIDLIRNEFDFQFSGEVGDDSMQEMGRMLGAQSIISGNFTDMGGFIRIMIRVLNVQNATVEVQYRANIVIDTITTALLTGGRADIAATTSRQTITGGSSSVPQSAQTSTGSMQTQTSPASTQPHIIAIEVTARSGGTLYFQNERVATLWDNEIHTIPIENPGTYILKMVFSDHEETRSVTINTRGISKISFGGVYTIGQTGPAGGIVFYDRGRYIDGWRYMEAAPRNITVTSEWGAYGQNVMGTSTALGTGKQNTQIIINHLNSTGEVGRAAELAQQYIQNGFTDWFLPSREELNLIYTNLRQRGLGNFPSGTWYWSSSQSNGWIEIAAWFQDFDNGNQMEYPYIGYGSFTKRSTFSVRAVRQF